MKTKRKRIENKWCRLMYLPLAILQWSFYTLLFSTLGICGLTPIALMYGIGNLITLNIEDAKESFTAAVIPIKLPFLWWYDYATKGEIGMYD